jgi:cell fate (sporulation/competence/biofilm development) regulator YlbF (YheA/YmcA/DUF963 family)
MIKTGGKELAKAGAKSALSSIAPKVATNMANRIGNEFIASSMLDNLLPVSRMLDKTGKPVTLYHSTPNKFTEFSDEMLGSNTGYDNTSLGHFVTPDKDFSKRFIDINNKGLKGQTMELQANIRNPILHPYMVGAKYKDPALRDKVVENYFLATDNQEGLNTLRDMMAEDALEFGNDANLYNEYMALADDPGGGGPFEFAGDERELLKKKGYDAVEIVEGPKSGLVEGSKDNSPISSYAVFNGENLRPVRHIPINQVSNTEEVPVSTLRKLFRGQKKGSDDLYYNKGDGTTGSATVGNGYYMTPNSEKAEVWAGEGINPISIEANTKDILSKNELIEKTKWANDLINDEAYMSELWGKDPDMADFIENLSMGRLPEISKYLDKPFIQPDSGQGEELAETIFFPDTRPELTQKIRDRLKEKSPKIRQSKVELSPQQQEFFKDSVVRDENGQLMEDIAKTGADKYLGKPKINYSLAEEPDITLYHGTPNKFEDFDDALPSVWFSDSDKNLRDTGLSIKGGQPMNIMERQLPKDLKIADEDLADRLTKQQLQDRGYAGIAYTERGPNGDETYYEIFNPNKTLRKMPKVQQSIDVRSRLINKAKNYKSLDRFEKMNNPIKDSEIWGEKPTSVFQRDSRAVRINMFPNEAVKGTGMTKQYLLNLLKDAYDQGITSIVPSYGSYTKEGASFMDHLAEQGWVKDTGKNGWKSYEIAPKITEWEKTDPLADIYNEAHNIPDIRLSKNGESLTDIANRIKAMDKSGEMSSNIKRIGSSGVAKIDKDTLPAGYDIVKKYLGKSPADVTKEIEDIIGVALDDPSAGDKLAKFVEDEGYDVSKNIIDNLNTARQILDERTLDELNMEGAQKYAQFVQTRGALAKDNPNRGVGPRTFTISADDDVLSQTDAAKLDKEYSDRLGIGRSHTPMNDKTLSSDAKGYYMGGGIGINPIHARGETGVSTIAHERMHAWQDINSGSWDSRVGEAIDELRNELKKFYHTKDQIKAYRKSGYDLDYYANDKEQEARMLQSYLDNEGFTDTYHKNDSRGVEWGDEIKPAFDKFYNKLRKLSKAGVALPAIALLFGLNTNSDDKSVDNIK